MTQRPLDPRICSASIDANALDRDGGSRDALVDRLLALYEAEKINLILPKGVRVEISNPNTPAHVQNAAPKISTTSLATRHSLRRPGWPGLLEPRPGQSSPSARTNQPRS